jgi:hypothetical protein
MFTFFSFSQIQIYSPLDAIKIGIENSKELKLLKEKAMKEEKISKYSLKDFFPEISLSFSQAESVKVNSNDNKNKALQIGLSQLIYKGGKTNIAYQLQRLNSELE